MDKKKKPTSRFRPKRLLLAGARKWNANKPKKETPNTAHERIDSSTACKVYKTWIHIVNPIDILPCSFTPSTPNETRQLLYITLVARRKRKTIIINKMKNVKQGLQPPLSWRIHQEPRPRISFSRRKDTHRSTQTRSRMDGHDCLVTHVSHEFSQRRFSTPLRCLIVNLAERWAQDERIYWQTVKKWKKDSRSRIWITSLALSHFKRAHSPAVLFVCYVPYKVISLSLSISLA